MEQPDLSCLWRRSFQQRRVLLRSKNCSSNVIKSNIKIIDVNNELWMWVHQKCGIGWIGRILNSVEINNCSYLAVPGYCLLNQQNNETYYLQFTISKIMMTKTIIIDCISMHLLLTCRIRNYCIGINIITWLTLLRTAIFQQQWVWLQSKNCSRNEIYWKWK